MIGLPITEMIVWGFLKGMVIGLVAVIVIGGVAALVEWRISKLTSRKKSHHDVTTDISQDEERPVVHVPGPGLPDGIHNKENNHFAASQINFSDWSLLVTGDVESPLNLRFDDLLKMPSHEIVSLMESAGTAARLCDAESIRPKKGTRRCE